MKKYVTGWLVALAAVATVACPADPAAAAGPGETPPAAHLTSETVDLGGGYGQTLWRDAAGAAHDLGLIFPLPGAAADAVTHTEAYASGGGDVPGMIWTAARRYGLDAARMERVARCENRGLNPGAVGDHGAAVGIYQFHPELWSATPQGRAGADRRNAAANVEAAMWAWSHGYRSHWSCQG